MAASIVLIGPGGAGKTTVSTLLAQKLGWTVIEVDTVRVQYRAEIGYDDAYVENLWREKGFPAVEQYWKPFDIHAVERVIQDYPENHVISFGAGNSVYHDAEHFARAQKALKNIRHVIQLLPAQDVDESIRILTERLRPMLDEGMIDSVMEVNRTFVRHPCNEALATVTFYNGDQTPEETAESIFQYIQLAT